MSAATIYAGRALENQQPTKPLMTLTARPDGAVSVSLAKAVSCRCGVMAMLFVNRAGKTLCLPCDAKANPGAE